MKKIVVCKCRCGKTWEVQEDAANNVPNPCPSTCTECMRITFEGKTREEIVGKPEKRGLHNALMAQLTLPEYRRRRREGRIIASAKYNGTAKGRLRNLRRQFKLRGIPFRVESWLKRVEKVFKNRCKGCCTPFQDETPNLVFTEAKSKRLRDAVPMCLTCKNRLAARMKGKRRASPTTSF